MKTELVYFALFVSLLFIGCSKGDNNNDINSCSSDFLTCYDGTKWTYDNHQDVVYRFSNNLNEPIEKWTLCLPPFEGYFYYDATNFELIENTNGRLEVTEILGDVEYTWTFETDENQLTIMKFPIEWPGIGGHLIETSIEVYALQGCN